MPARNHDARRRCDAGTVCYAAEHGIFVVIAGNAVVRFRAAEFAAASELMQAALAELADLLQDDYDITWLN